jgi:hypothetical protein
VPLEYTVGDTDPALPGADLNYPSFSAISAGAWVMFARKPNHTATGAAAAALAEPEALEALEELGALEELELLEEQPAMRSAPPVTATAPAKMPRIYSFHSLSVKSG